MVEHELPKLGVAGSSPVSRSREALVVSRGWRSGFGKPFDASLCWCRIVPSSAVQRRQRDRSPPLRGQLPRFASRVRRCATSTRGSSARVVPQPSGGSCRRRARGWHACVVWSGAWTSARRASVRARARGTMTARSFVSPPGRLFGSRRSMAGSRLIRERATLVCAAPSRRGALGRCRRAGLRTGSCRSWAW